MTGGRGSRCLLPFAPDTRVSYCLLWTPLKDGACLDIGVSSKGGMKRPAGNVAQAHKSLGHDSCLPVDRGVAVVAAWLGVAEQNPENVIVPVAFENPAARQGRHAC